MQKLIEHLWSQFKGPWLYVHALDSSCTRFLVTINAWFEEEKSILLSARELRAFAERANVAQKSFILRGRDHAHPTFVLMVPLTAIKNSKAVIDSVMSGAIFAV